VTHHFTPETENVEFYDVTKKNDLMAAINSLNRLICYQEKRKYQACRVASSFNCLIKQN
jgi:peroxiredoxin